MLTAAVAIALVMIGGFWIAGGVLLRVAWSLPSSACSRWPSIMSAGVVLLVVGVLPWLVGQWHYALPFPARCAGSDRSKPRRDARL